MKLLDVRGELRREHRKSYVPFTFEVPASTAALRVLMQYDPGGDDPHGLQTLQIFDPNGFRGAGHRFAPDQIVEIGVSRATPGFVPGAIPAGQWTVEVDFQPLLQARWSSLSPARGSRLSGVDTVSSQAASAHGRAWARDRGGASDNGGPPDRGLSG